jgi:choline kinase
MKAIILAAGKGSRISDKIDGIPKSTLKLQDGTPIIRNSVQNMIEFGVEPIVCVGYKKEKIFEALEGLQVKYYDNPFFSITNNIASLWFAKEEFGDDDIVLTSADLYYPKEFLEKLISVPTGLAMLVDSSKIQSGDFYFSVKDGFIMEYGPHIPLETRTYEYMGLTKISKQMSPIIKKRIEQYIENENFNKYFEDMIISLNREERHEMEFVDVKGSFWKEFDFYEDYLAILQYEKGQ